jgi:hypothetical protein
MKRLSWSKLFNLTALLSLGLVTSVTSANGATVQGPTAAAIEPRVPAYNTPGNPNSGIKAWEGLLTTSFLSTQQISATATTQPVSIAVGPINIITLTHGRIAIYDNPNAIIPATGADPSTGPVATQQRAIPLPTNVQINPGATLFTPNYPPTSEAFLSAMVGETALRDMCPNLAITGGGGVTSASCVIDNATVRYDQMQGRYLIGFTVTDIGVQTVPGPVTLGRKSSWVLIVSQFSTFPTIGLPGSSDVFICASGTAANCNRPGSGLTSIAGGLNVKNWTMYYGSASDGFGGTFGNINNPNGTTVPPAAGLFDCSVTAASSQVCYFPTSFRIGLDNDNVIITSAVVNTNLPVGTNQFGGTRVRVLKKGGGSAGSPAGFYQKSLSGTALAPITDYVDLYAIDTANATPNSPLPAGAFAAPFGYSPYTLAPANTNSVTVAGLTASNGIFCEPARVRGRAAASYTNPMVPVPSIPANLTSQNYIECTISIPNGPAATNVVLIQPINYNVTQFSFFQGPQTTNASVQYTVALPTGFDGTIATMQQASVPAFTNAKTVPQAPSSIITTPPNLYVGDNRPHEVVMREGYLYDARVGIDPGATRTDGAQNSTVYVDVLQKLNQGTPGGVVNGIFRGYPVANTDAYAPEFDVPGNVTTKGQTPQIKPFQWLEKQFFSTTFPALSPSDPRTQAGGTQGSQAGITNCTGVDTLPNTVGGVPNVVNGVQVTPRSWASLYKQRCGTDVFDTVLQFRDPITGVLTVTTPNVTPAQSLVMPGVRGSAALDPNNGSIWAYGLYATRRFSVTQGFGQFGTYISNWDLAYQADPYGDSVANANDCTDPVSCPAFVPVQIALDQGIVTLDGNGNVGINAPVTRREMARYVVLSMMDEPAIAAFLNATGGCTTSFADVASECAGGTSAQSVPAAGNPTNFWRYIEVMARKRITTGCFANDAVQRFCPTDPLNRAQMAVFLVRAKMSNVYPSVISGCPTPQTPACPGVTGGDNFGLTISTVPYFTDVTSDAANPWAPYFLYIQKMYELRLTNGIAPPPSAPAYGPGQTLTRGQLLVFLVRAFFY